MASSKPLNPSALSPSNLTESDGVYGMSPVSLFPVSNPNSDLSAASSASSSCSSFSLLPEQRLQSVPESHGYHHVPRHCRQGSDMHVADRHVTGSDRSSSISSDAGNRRWSSALAAGAAPNEASAPTNSNPPKGCLCSRMCVKCASRFTVDCAAVCCCPVALLHLATLAFIRLPTAMAWKMMVKLKSRISRRRRQRSDAATTNKVNDNSARPPDASPASPQAAPHAVKFDSQNLLEHFGAVNLGFGGDLSMHSSASSLSRRGQPSTNDSFDGSLNRLSSSDELATSSKAAAQYAFDNQDLLKQLELENMGFTGDFSYSMRHSEQDEMKMKT